MGAGVRPPQPMASEKVKQLYEQLKQGVQEVFTSGKLEEFFAFQAKFHRYSFANTVMIFSQCPHATMVAGYNRWKELGRYVKKGEKAIKIFAPLTFKEKDPETGEETGETIVKGFKVVNVFDVSQTDGKPLPTLAEAEYGDTAAGRELFDRLVAVSPVPVFVGRIGGGAGGHYSNNEGRIVLSENLTGNKLTAVLIHEICHALAFRMGEQKRHKSRKDEEYVKGEIVAEGAAYVVGRYFGIDMPASFEYVAAWAKDPDRVIKYGTAVQKVAARLIDLVEKAGKKAVAA
ncbi:MAG: hypothetical protein IMW95_12350 [Moorella humiferrea]|nr:hypothetical protein [Moorella humiferrea]